VLVHLYEERGPHFAEALRGMFGIAIWDAPKHRLVLARDRYGIKPLYYRATDDGVSFASELKALLRQPGLSREIDPDGLEAYLAFSCIPAPLTIFREVRKLPAGNVLIWSEDDGEARVERFAQPRTAPIADERSESEEELAEELRDRLRDSVRAHLIADVPVGILLSGGIDSSALAALAAEEASEPLRTFSIGFEERSFDELADARLVAERYGTQHRELVLRPDAALLLPALADAFDEPFADSSALPTYLVAQLAAEDVKVAISGEGGDELFGGYYTYAADLLAERAGWTAPFLRPIVERLPSSSARASFDYRAKRFVRAAQLPPLERHHGWKEIFSPDARAELTGRRNGFDPVDLLRVRFAETEGAELIARLQDVDLGTYLVDDLLVKTDRASMAHSLEARVPFLDPVVTNFSLGLAGRHKVHGLRKKILLRKAAAPLIPPELLRRRKRGFSIPAAAWLRGDLEPFARETLSAETLRRQGFFRPEAVTRLIDGHVAGREDLSRQLWGLLAFTLWHERHVERTPGALREPRLEALA
jgi:asparagine synthase (glutamine-hydrolysing)